MLNTKRYLYIKSNGFKLLYVSIKSYYISLMHMYGAAVGGNVVWEVMHITGRPYYASSCFIITTIQDPCMGRLV